LSALSVLFKQKMSGLVKISTLLVELVACQLFGLVTTCTSLYKLVQVVTRKV
jgi:fluoride ion exporter CrcB/FEX